MQDVPDASASDGYTLGYIELRKLTGLSDRQLRLLADDGRYPVPIHGKFKNPDTLHGLIAHYQCLARKRSDGESELKKEKLRKSIMLHEKDIALKDQEIAIGNKDLISSDEIRQSVSAICEQTKAALMFKLCDQIPMLSEGKSVAEIRVICRGVFNEICGTMQGWARKHGVENKE